MASIALGFTGVAIIGWSDLSFIPSHLKGDGLALLASLLFTVYFLLGKRLRTKLPTGVYVPALYGIASLWGFLTLLVLGLPFSGYTQQTWFCFLLMALIPTMIGHTALNNALNYIGAGHISAATLVEPLLAGLVAYFAWSETMTGLAILGYAVISSSVLVLVMDFKTDRAQ